MTSPRPVSCISVLAVFTGFFLSHPGMAAPRGDSPSIPLFQLSLAQTEARALATSSALKASTSATEGSEAGARTAGAALLPSLSLQGTYFYQTEVPSESIGPLGTLQFGTHNNYAVGPVLSYTLFDGGKNGRSSKSADFMADSARQTALSRRLQITLEVRQTYFRAQYALRQVDVTADSLRLSQAQARDIDLRFRAGAASKLDQIQSHRDVLNYQLKFRQVQNDLSATLRDLIALTDPGLAVDLSKPIPDDLTANSPEGIDAPTFRISLDAIPSTLDQLGGQGSPKLSSQGLNAEHPELRALSAQVESSHLAAESERSGLLPKIALQARSQYTYPDVVIPQAKLQNVFMATLSLPLYEASATQSRAAQKESESIGSDYQKAQRRTDMERDDFKARDALVSLQAQRKISEENVAEAREVGRLTYQSYKAGKSRYLDVQDANLKLLEAEVSSAQIDTNILNVAAMIAYLEN